MKLIKFIYYNQTALIGSDYFQSNYDPHIWFSIDYCLQAGAYVTKTLKEINPKMQKDEQLKRFRVVADEWTPESGDLSPTLKLKRRIVFAKYKDVIGEIFGN